MDELSDLNDIIVENEAQEEIVLATVTEVGTEGVKILIDGSDEAGEKEYKVNSIQKIAAGDRVKIFKNSGTYLIEYRIGAPMEDYPIPAGGTDGQYLVKDGSNNYAVKWMNPPSTHGIPSGGSAGQTLVKSSNDNYAVSWSDLPHGIPAGGTAGQILAKKTGTDYDVQWVTQTHDIPTGGTDGQYLVKNGNTNYSVKWASAPSTDRLTYSSHNVIFNGSALYPSGTCSLGSSSYYFNGCYISGAVRLGNNSYNSTLGFFGTNPISKKNTITTSSSLATVIQALKDYGLF